MIGETIEAGNNFYPVCPYCDMEVDDVETRFYEFCDEYVFMYRRGTCPFCKRDYKWMERYTWNAKFYDVEEV